jgi:hypothetical protein
LDARQPSAAPFAVPRPACAAVQQPRGRGIHRVRADVGRERLHQVPPAGLLHGCKPTAHARTRRPKDRDGDAARAWRRPDRKHCGRADAAAAEASETWYEDDRIEADAVAVGDVYHLKQRSLASRSRPATAGCGGLLWRALEDYALRNSVAEKMRVSCFTGPMFDRVQVQAGYWKIAAWAESGELRSIAMIADQRPVIWVWPEAPEGFTDEDEIAKVEDFVTTVARGSPTRTRWRRWRTSSRRWPRSSG